MATIDLELSVYGGTDTRRFTVPATIVGELAVHRAVAWYRGNEHLSTLKSWTVTHIATGHSVRLGTPPRFWDRGGFIARKRDLVAWAREFQDKASAWFDAVRDNDGAAMQRLRGEAKAIGEAL